MNPSAICEICGQERNDSVGWFLVHSDGDRDRVSVLHWDARRAHQKSMHAVCGAEHARELVARWAFSGTLCCGAQGSRWRLGAPVSCCPQAAKAGDPLDIDLQGLRNAEPETLLAILDAVEIALQDKWRDLDRDDQEVLVYDA